MVERYSFGPVVARRGQQMKCPQCRHKTRHADIAYVSTRRSRDALLEAAATTGDVSVKGDHSTKIEGVVRCLLQITSNEPDAKSLVFSTVYKSADFVIYLVVPQSDAV